MTLSTDLKPSTARRRVTRECLQLIEQFEGRKLTTYIDVAGVATAGVGHTGKDVINGKTYSNEQVDQWLQQDAQEARDTIYRFIPLDIIAQIPVISWDALISFVFNVGAQAFRDPVTGKKTNFAKTLEAGLFDQVDDRMRDWDKARVNGQLRRVAGLTNRRAVESSRWNGGFEEMQSMLMSAAVPVSETEATAVPEPPEKKPIIPRETAIGAATAAAGAATAMVPDLVMETGRNIRSMVGDIPIFNLIGALIVVVGLGLVIWREIKRHRNSGA